MVEKNNSNNSEAVLLVDTSAFHTGELSKYIDLSEEINSRERHKAEFVNPMLSKAHLTREEIFECTQMDDEEFLTAIDNDQSPMGCTQVTDLDATQSFENILRYFDEDVNIRSSNSSTPTLQQFGNRMVKAVKFASTPFLKQTYNEKYSSVQDLKTKYELVESEKSKNNKKSNKSFGMQNVKQMAQMFNNRISQFMNTTNAENKSYNKFNNEFSPEAKPIIKPIIKPTEKLERPSFPIYHSTSSPKPSPIPRRKHQIPVHKETIRSPLVNEEVFCQLSVKDKAQLFQKFIKDFTDHSNEFKKHAKELEEKVNGKLKENNSVIQEKQESVKNLAKEFEAKINSPKHTFSNTASKQYDNSMNKNLPVPSPRNIINSQDDKKVAAPKSPKKPLIDITPEVKVVNEVKVFVKTPGQIKKKRVNCKDVKSKEIISVEPCGKRSNKMIRFAYSTEPYAPPKKIRRTRDERFAPKIVFKNAKIETLFYSWLNEGNYDAYDNKNSDTEKELDTEIDIKNSDTEKELDAVIEVNNSDTEKDLNAEIVPPENKTKTDKNPFDTLEKPVKLLKNELLHSGKSSPLDEIPAFKPKAEPKIETTETTNSEPQIGKHETKIEEVKEDTQLIKSLRTPRKKKTRRSLNSKKDSNVENDVIAASTIPAVTTTTTDSDSDSKIVEANKKHNLLIVQKAMQKCNNQIKKLLHSNHKPFKLEDNIKSAYTLTVLTTPSPSTETDVDPCPTPTLFEEQPQNEFANKTSDQGFETASFDTDSLVNQSEKNLAQEHQGQTPIKCKLIKRESGDSACESTSNCSTPLRESPRMVAPQFYSPINPPPKPKRRFFNEEIRRNSVPTMQVIREGHLLETQRASLNFGKGVIEAKLPADPNATINGETSKYWIKAGDVTITLPIFYIAPDRLRLLYDMFYHKSTDRVRVTNFGIDNQKFINNPSDTEEILQSLPEFNANSQYWFSINDLAVPFTGKFMHPQRVKRIFKFINDNLTEYKDARIRFGIDDLDFTKNTENAPPSSPKLSMDSDYTMLLGLETFNESISPEDRNKILRACLNNTSDFYNFDNDMSRQSLTPLTTDSLTASPFRTSFNTDKFEELFEGKNFGRSTEISKACLRQGKNKLIKDMLDRLQQQETKLQTLEDEVRKYSGLSDGKQQEIMEQCGKVPEYINRLKRAVKIIEKLFNENGLEFCSVEQLDTYTGILSRYADICLESCSEHFGKVYEHILCQSKNSI